MALPPPEERHIRDIGKYVHTNLYPSKTSRSIAPKNRFGSNICNCLTNFALSTISAISSNSLAVNDQNMPLPRSLENFLMYVYYKYSAPLELSLAAIPPKTAKNPASSGPPFKDREHRPSAEFQRTRLSIAGNGGFQKDAVT